LIIERLICTFGRG